MPKSRGGAGRGAPGTSSDPAPVLSIAEALASALPAAAPAGPSPAERAREQRATLATMASRSRSGGAAEQPASRAPRSHFAELFRHLHREATGGPPLKAPSEEPTAVGTAPLQFNRSLEVSPGHGGHAAEPAPDGRRLLLRDARRAWMSSSFRRTPHAILVLSLRLARVPGANTPAAEALLARTGRGMRQAVETLGPVYELSPCVCAVLLKDNAVRRVVRIAEAIGAAVGRRSAENPLSPLLFAAGVAALHRDDDPVAIVCLAEACLRTAERSDTSRVVSEGDPEMRRKGR